MRRAGASLQQILSAYAWRDTAEFFGITDVIDASGGQSPIVPILRCQRRKVRDQVVADPRITGLLIAQDEATRISAAIRTLQPFVERVLVLDGGSQDGTPEVARKLGASVLTRPFDDDFAVQRNFALEHVKTDWVLTLDCDERMPADLGSLLVSLIAQTEAEAVIVPRLNFVEGIPEPTLWPDPQPRAFRSHLRYKGRVHERLMVKTAVYTPLNGPAIQHYKSALRHYRNSLHYSDIDPRQATAANTEWMRHEVARLEGLHEGDG